MKRDYNLPKAIFYFAEQKIKETWWLWSYLAILAVVEYLGSDLTCSDCSPLGEFILLRFMLLPIWAIAAGACLALIVYGILALREDLHLWIFTLRSWVRQNWNRAKARAKYE